MTIFFYPIGAEIPKFAVNGATRIPQIGAKAFFRDAAPGVPKFWRIKDVSFAYEPNQAQRWIEDPDIVCTIEPIDSAANG